MKVSDFFAELYVAGRFADAGWNVYFPRRDRGFDFIASKALRNGMQLLRPVQVKGKYPTAEKSDKDVYGYVGELTELHPEMVLAIPFFSETSQDVPTCIAYLPFTLIRRHSRGFRCQPATFRNGQPIARRDYAKFFDKAGLDLLSHHNWSTQMTTCVVEPKGNGAQVQKFLRENRLPESARPTADEIEAQIRDARESWE
jgi:hypothetical protein